MRFFFDIVCDQSQAYDFHGQYFEKQEDAEDMARLIALDLANSENNNWVGSQVEVKCVAGRKLVSFPIEFAA